MTLLSFTPLNATNEELATEENVVSDLMNRVSALEDQNRELMGSFEESKHETQELKSRLDRALSDMELRLNELEGHKSGAPLGITPTPTEAKLGQEELPIPLGEGVKKDTPENIMGTLGAAGSGAAAGAAGITTIASSKKEEKAEGGEAAYEKARELLEKGDYEAAEKAFASFVKDHPKDELAGKAQYWLGVTHYVRGSYESAAAAFAKGYKTYGKSEKAPDMLFKLAKSLEAMDRKSDACKALAQLQSSHPKSHKSESTKLIKALSCPN
ncbi:tol-pal system protein YbgF [Candidatus Bealeia paramacronuclearis]